MVSEFKGGTKFELVGPIFLSGAGEAGGITEVPRVRSEVLVAATIAYETGQSVVYLQIETAQTAEWILDAFLVFALQTVIDGSAHGIIHEHTSNVWIDASEGRASIGSESKVRSGVSPVIDIAGVETVVGKIVNACARIVRDIAGHYGRSIGLGNACWRTRRDIICDRSCDRVESGIRFQVTGIAGMVHIHPDLEVQADVAQIIYRQYATLGNLARTPMFI